MTGARARQVPVLIAGGGGSGLTAAIVLADLGVPSLLVERHPSTSPHPKAHILNGRTMEIMAQHGLAEEIYSEGAPPETCSAMVWLTSLGGHEPYDRKVLYRTDAYGGGTLEPRYSAVCAQRHGNLGQHKLEPLLRRYAERRNPDGLLFGHELAGFVQDADGVTATIVNRETGADFTVRAKYLIGADGGKTVGRALGVRMLGTPTFLQWINLHVKADFSALIDHDDAIVNRVSSLAEDGRFRHCGVVPMGPTRWGRHSEEWTLMLTQPPGSADDRADHEVVAQVRETLKLPARHRMEVLSVSRWPVEGSVAERFAVGRVYLVGDAAHRHPPSGGLGLNTGIQDAHNLAWKLAATLAGAGGGRLLASYEAERRPVAERVVERALYSLFNQIAMTTGTGVTPAGTPKWNRAQLLALFGDSADQPTRRAVLEEYFATNRITTEHLGLEIGYRYDRSPCVLPDGSSGPPPDPLGLAYVQDARPGHRMPHAWLDQRGQRVGTHHLLRPGAFLCLAGASGQAWRDAGLDVALSTGVPLDLYMVGPGHELRDREGDWTRLRGHGEEGVVLVRPDGFVAARADTIARAAAQAGAVPGDGRGPTAWLQRALGTALGAMPAGTMPAGTVSGNGSVNGVAARGRD